MVHTSTSEVYGAHVLDPDGTRFLECGMALRAVNVGYAEDEIDQAAWGQIRNGNNLTRPSLIELEPAELLVGLIASVDMVKFAKDPWIALSYRRGESELAGTERAVYRRALEDGVERYLEGTGHQDGLQKVQWSRLMNERYKETLQIDHETTARYYTASITRKSEQHKQLEQILRGRGLQPRRIADVACGGGGSSFHLVELYREAHYTLVDLNEEAIDMARETMRGRNATCFVGDIYHLDLPDNSFDLVVCWQTLSWIEQPEAALRELVRICKPGAFVYASSLFESRHDVDVYSQVFDHTRPSSAHGLHYVYNTYSLRSVRQWIDGLVSELQLHEFEIPIDLDYEGRGLGTRTVRLETGKRLQLSAGMLLNWGILEVRK